MSRREDGASDVLLSVFSPGPLPPKLMDNCRSELVRESCMQTQKMHRLYRPLREQVRTQGLCIKWE
ncbi:hypothetical protein E0I00_08055 [Pseudomonas syringae pv. actinidiae]|uniref:Uncharacterized protein n=1 Tax=Pseudomonas syringae pv. actinidiae TaxID=103796 RepID=A0AAU8XBH8_PSESF|nr:hypothetical protein CT122_00325 [Pseudomonas syringae pv. actinidiae]NVL59134.1 hypothetical protein [Pseudomonas syringae pv. actinidiae]